MGFLTAFIGFSLVFSVIGINHRPQLRQIRFDGSRVPFNGHSSVIRSSDLEKFPDLDDSEGISTKTFPEEVTTPIPVPSGGGYSDDDTQLTTSPPISDGDAQIQPDFETEVEPSIISDPRTTPFPNIPGNNDGIPQGSYQTPPSYPTYYKPLPQPNGAYRSMYQQPATYNTYKQPYIPSQSYPQPYQRPSYSIPQSYGQSYQSQPYIPPQSYQRPSYGIPQQSYGIQQQAPQSNDMNDLVYLTAQGPVPVNPALGPITLYDQSTISQSIGSPQYTGGSYQQPDYSQGYPPSYGSGGGYGYQGQAAAQQGSYGQWSPYGTSYKINGGPLSYLGK